jgi:hypothetical protein
MFRYSETEERTSYERFVDGSERRVERTETFEVTGPRALILGLRRLRGMPRHLRAVRKSLTSNR